MVVDPEEMLKTCPQIVLKADFPDFYHPNPWTKRPARWERCSFRRWE
jgi:hypothetical protein